MVLTLIFGKVQNLHCKAPLANTGLTVVRQLRGLCFASLLCFALLCLLDFHGMMNIFSLNCLRIKFSNNVFFALILLSLSVIAVEQYNIELFINY